MICLRRYEVSVERIADCNVTEKFAENGMLHLSSFGTNDVICVLPQ